MIGLFFEVMPRMNHEQAYFDIAAGLKTELEKNPGLLFIDRFKSLKRPRIVLSHSHWRDEASLARWRTAARHHVAQIAGRQQHFENYRLRIAQLVCEWLPQLDRLRLIEVANSYNDPALQAERFMIALTAHTPEVGEADTEVWESVYREREYVALAPAQSLSEGCKAVERISSTGHVTSARIYLVSRDYGMYDRKEAPQYFKAIDEPIEDANA